MELNQRYKCQLSIPIPTQICMPWVISVSYPVSVCLGKRSSSRQGSISNNQLNDVVYYTGCKLNPLMMTFIESIFGMDRKDESNTGNPPGSWIIYFKIHWFNSIVPHSKFIIKWSLCHSYNNLPLQMQTSESQVRIMVAHLAWRSLFFVAELNQLLSTLDP